MELKVKFFASQCHLKSNANTPLDKRCNFFHCEIEIDLSCIESYILELSLLAMKAAISRH